ncbi:MAG: AAA family ATPase [Verrucomicrobiota bacterium]
MPALLIVLCGPNGAGKSTFYEIILKSRGFPFVNADLIAAEKFGTEAAAHALAAAKLADAERRRLIAEKTSFIMETMLSDSAGNKLAFFRDARNAGYLLKSSSSASIHPKHPLHGCGAGPTPEAMMSRSTGSTPVILELFKISADFATLRTLLRFSTTAPAAIPITSLLI